MLCLDSYTKDYRGVDFKMELWAKSGFCRLEKAFFCGLGGALEDYMSQKFEQAARIGLKVNATKTKEIALFQTREGLGRSL